jgi:hypothetical protein
MQSQVVPQYEVGDVADRQFRKGANGLSIEPVRELEKVCY